jgi:hypothetical protein
VPQTSISLPFGDGVYDFRLGLAQINEVQTRSNAGIGEVFARLIAGRYFKVTPAGEIAIGDPAQAQYRIEDIVGVIRQGLLGGGRGMVDGVEVKVDAARANTLIDNYVLGASCPIKDAWALAAAIMTVAVEGYEPPDAPAAKTVKKKAVKTVG